MKDVGTRTDEWTASRTKCFSRARKLHYGLITYLPFRGPSLELVKIGVEMASLHPSSYLGKFGTVRSRYSRLRGTPITLRWTVRAIVTWDDWISRKFGQQIQILKHRYTHILKLRHERCIFRACDSPLVHKSFTYLREK